MSWVGGLLHALACFAVLNLLRGCFVCWLLAATALDGVEMRGEGSVSTVRGGAVWLGWPGGLHPAGEIRRGEYDVPFDSILCMARFVTACRELGEKLGLLVCFGRRTCCGVRR